MWFGCRRSLEKSVSESCLVHGCALIANFCSLPLPCDALPLLSSWPRRPASTTTYAKLGSQRPARTRRPRAKACGSTNSIFHFKSPPTACPPLAGHCDGLPQGRQAGPPRDQKRLVCAGGHTSHVQLPALTGTLSKDNEHYSVQGAAGGNDHSTRLRDQCAYPLHVDPILPVNILCDL